jgi:hypothetical protein
MKKSEATYVELCDALVSDPHYENAAAKLGCAASTIFRWIQASQKEPAAHTFVWCDAEAPLHVKLINRLTDAVPILHTRAPVSITPL